MTPERGGKVKRHTHGETGNDETVGGSKRKTRGMFSLHRTMSSDGWEAERELVS
jgi:hypothetical protein